MAYLFLMLVLGQSFLSLMELYLHVMQSLDNFFLLFLHGKQLFMKFSAFSFSSNIICTMSFNIIKSCFISSSKNLVKEENSLVKVVIMMAMNKLTSKFFSKI